MDDPSTPGFDGGFDFATGNGFIQADAALALVVAECPGDLNNDRIIDADDLGIFAGEFGSASCGVNCIADRNGDEDADGMDLDKFIRQYVEGCD